MSLFKRIIGLESPKVPIHLAQSVISEVSRDRLTVEQAVELLSLSEQEDVDQFLYVLSKASANPNPPHFSNRVFNYLCLGELGVKSPRDYTDEALFISMIDEEANNG